MTIRLDLAALNRAYDNGASPKTVINSVYDSIDRIGPRPIWITLVSRQDALIRAEELEKSDRSKLPLYGVPFAVKDNIDVAGLPTTAACPQFSYYPEQSATVVTKLIEAGAILIGKTNLDQFATGLVGVRTPYGICSSVFGDNYISGGSSSGSAVAVAKGLVSFALGTDTAGSGRVPAAFNNIVGLKPTKGLISTSGVVPACRSLDCVSIFALTTSDAAAVFNTVVGFDPTDSFSRPVDKRTSAAPWLNSSFRFGIPRPEQREFFGDTEAEILYDNAIQRLASLGGEPIEIDFQPYIDTAALLYSGPWVAERLAAIQQFFTANKSEMNPVVRSIVEQGANYTSVDTFNAQYQLAELKSRADQTWRDIDILLLPTSGAAYTIREVLDEPIKLNTNLGHYTNFVNLLDLAAIAIPSGFRQNGIPFGVTLLGQANADSAIAIVADRLHRLVEGNVGGIDTKLEDTEKIASPNTPPGCTLLSVVGAHLTGQPLNHQLTSRKARLTFTAKTASSYKLYALPNTAPEKPGLVKSPGFVGPGIELEVWAIPTSSFGAFVAEIPSPLGIGTVELENGATVKGFICEPSAIDGAAEITHFGGWRNYLASKTKL